MNLEQVMMQTIVTQNNTIQELTKTVQFLQNQLQYQAQQFQTYLAMREGSETTNQQEAESNSVSDEPLFPEDELDGFSVNIGAGIQDEVDAILNDREHEYTPPGFDDDT